MNKSKVEVIFHELMTEGLRMDLLDPNLRDTPARVAKMYVEEFFCNIGKEFKDWKSFPNDREYSQIIMLDNIEFVSMCSHHFLPFSGLAWVLYIPSKVLCGASKPARCVEHYSKRPQLQETLCHDVLSNLVEHVKPQGALVFMRAVHNCMVCRGVRQNRNAGMGTSALYGVFEKEDAAREEAFDMINLSVKMSS